MRFRGNYYMVSAQLVERPYSKSSFQWFTVKLERRIYCGSLINASVQKARQDGLLRTFPALDFYDSVIIAVPALIAAEGEISSLSVSFNHFCARALARGVRNSIPALAQAMACPICNIHKHSNWKGYSHLSTKFHVRKLSWSIH